MAIINKHKWLLSLMHSLGLIIGELLALKLENINSKQKLVILFWRTCKYSKRMGLKPRNIFEKR